MIEVIGDVGSAEHRTALKIARVLERYWPGIGSSSAAEEHVKIAANRKLSGYKVSDIDIVLAAKLGPSRYIVPKTSLKDREGKRLLGAKIRVRSFVAAIEVKDHDAHGMSISGPNVDVQYSSGPKSATAQNDAQKYALLNFLKDETGKDPWVYRCLVLEGISELPRDRGRTIPAAATVASSFDVASLLTAMLAENAVGKIGNDYAMSSGDPDLIEKVLVSRIFTNVTPSALDRKKMDRIAARLQEAQDLASLLGHERVHLRGEGGTGKTVLLAQAAHEAFRSRGTRSLFLTYNHALAADIQRVLALMGVPSSGDNGGVDVRTVMSFVYAWLSRLGIVLRGEDLHLDLYETRCAEALRYFEQGALGNEDIRRARREDPEQFDYNALLVDEAQDWPQAEADLVCRLYGGERVSLADGISQLVRSGATNWRSSVTGRSHEGSRSLEECLRMKANLGAFANAVAEQAGLNWKIKPSREAVGGRVIIVTRPIAELAGLRGELMDRATAAGNEPIDLLYCVPPSDIRLEGTVRTSMLSQALRGEGAETWDGTDPIVRRDFPRSIKEHRIVQYESSRGLEGWIVMLDGLDEFWDLKRAESSAVCAQPSSMVDSTTWARARAWFWTMIPLTRAIDTLVITLRDKDSAAGQLLLEVAKAMPDVVRIE